MINTTPLINLSLRKNHVVKKRNFISHEISFFQRSWRVSQSAVSDVSSKKYPSLRLFVSSTTPSETFFNTCFDKNTLKSLIAWFLEKYGEKWTVDLVETFKYVGFHQATQAGVSLGLDDLEIPPQKAFLLSQASLKLEMVKNATQTGNVTSVEKSQRLIDTWNQTSESLRQTAVQNFATTNPVNPVYMMAFSGARGNISQVRQLVAMRGLMADPQGAILEFPIQSNFREGLTLTEYLISCYGARKGLVDTALRTATSGYLTRRLVDAVQHVVIHVIDCETQRGIPLKDKKLEHRLVGRVLLEDLHLSPTNLIKKNTLVSHRLAKQLASHSTEIRVRSPLTCQTEKSVCQLCYGLDLSQGKLVSLGEAVGIIAAQSIGEPGTQLTMRTFHTGGVGVFSEQALKTFTAPFDGTVQFLDSLPGLFVRTPYGQIVYLLKHKPTEEKKPLLQLRPVSGPLYSLFQDDIPSGSLLWVKQGEYVKSGQLLIQASRLQKATQEMPESIHPVRSPLSGEIFFQSIRIRVVKEIREKKKKKKDHSLFLHQSELPEISPVFPTLVKLGNFWIFSSFIQKESSLPKSFFVKGDLVSRETPLQEYTFHSPEKGQLQRIDSALVLGSNTRSFLLSTVDFLNSCYVLQSSFKKNKLSLVTSIQNRKYSSLSWYPCFNSGISFRSGFCIPLGFEKPLLSVKGLRNTQKRVQTTDFLWSSRQLFRFVTPHHLNPVIKIKPKKNIFLFPSCFVITQNGFSEKGLLHIQKTSTNSRWKTYPKTSNCVRNSFHTDTHFEKRSLSNQIKDSLFLKNALQYSRDGIFLSTHFNLIQKNRMWLYFPTTQLSKNVVSQLVGSVLQPNTQFEKTRFDTCFLSVDVLKTDKVFISNRKCKPYDSALSGVIHTIRNLNTKFTEKPTVVQSVSTVSTSQTFHSENQKNFCFYKSGQSFKPVEFIFAVPSKRQIFHVLAFQKTSHYRIPDRHVVKQNWIETQKNSPVHSLSSPVFTKQYRTKITSFQTPQGHFQQILPSRSGWFGWSQLFQVDITWNSFNMIQKVDQLHKSFFLSNSKAERGQSDLHDRKSWSLNHLSVPGWNFFYYRKLRLQDTTNLVFETFSTGLVLKHFVVTRAFLKVQKLGEFRGFKTKQKKVYISLLRPQDVLAIKPPEFNLVTEKLNRESPKVRIKTKLRLGHELVSGFVSPASGQVIKLNHMNITIRKGVPFLASRRGLLHISHNAFVEKNHLLMTLKSRRLQTEDIVQGIPKIEQLFEARETRGGEIIPFNMHFLLDQFFRRAKKRKPLRDAVRISLNYIQRYLVDSIIEAYSNQGVTIAEKHVEVVVRQMTARVQITQRGDTGLLPGEFVQRRVLEKLNDRLEARGGRTAHYKPLILGITKSVLQSESFLLAASFQQVSRVLVRSALAKKTDFLRGLHENVLVGQPIPAGTGSCAVKFPDRKQVMKTISEKSQSTKLNSQTDQATQSKKQSH